MENFKENIILDTYTIRQALFRLDKIGIQGNVLFIVDEFGELKGTLTDGDIRRGLLKDLNVNSLAIETAQLKFHFIIYSESNEDLNEIRRLKTSGIKLVPLVDNNKILIRIINIDNYKGFLPVDVFILAGGRGQRLMPLTIDCPKPMLRIGSKPIIEHNIDRLISFGVKNFTVSTNYLSKVIEDYFGNGFHKGISLKYVKESQPLGTIGSITLVPEFNNDNILIMNSDLLTDIDFLDFFEFFVSSNFDMCIATIPYSVDIPYAVLEITDKNYVNALKEKPKYTYYSNAGIYLIKKEILKLIPINQHYNATDLIEDIIKKNGHVGSFPILSYWLDIGKMPDYLKAQEDVKHLRI